MQKLLLTVLLGFPGLTSLAQTPVRMPLQAVTLYLNGAELHHQAEISLPAGAVEVRLTGLAPGLNGSSIQAEVSGAELEGVETVAAARQTGAAPVTLLDSLHVAQAALMKLKTEEVAIAAEKEFLQQNKQLASVTPGRWVEETQRAAAFYSARLGALSQRDTEAKERQAAKISLINSLSQRAGLGAGGAGHSEVVLRLSLPRAGSVRLTLGYLLPGSNTRWTPEYELRVSESNLRQLRVVSRARLYNNTGLAWNNLPVSLRNATPDDEVSRPALDPWAVSFGRGGNVGEGRLDDFAVKGPGTTGSTASSTEEPDLGARLRLLAPVTLGTAGSRVVKLSEQALPMRLEYLAIPKAAEGVFLVGKVSDWNKVSFLTETADVFFRGAYVGETTLDTRAYTDTLEVALGRDPQVQLSRTKREDFVSSTNGGSRERTKLTYELNVKNSHPYPIPLRLLDQVPVSLEKDISVKVIEISGAQLDGPSGKLTWLFTLAPGASRKLGISFQVEAPADKKINLRRDRSIKSPKYR